MPPSAASPSAQEKRRRIWSNRYLVGVGGVLLLAGGSYLLWSKLLAKKSDVDQYQIATVQRADIEDLVTATGNLQPRDYVDVGAQVSGQLKKIHVEIGSVVKAGDLLAEIDPTVYKANVDARRAQLRNLQASMAERQSQAVLSQQQLDRQKSMMASDATTSEALQQAEAAVRSARSQIDALQAQMEQAESTLRADEANLNYADIFSPISGVVVSITARQGQTINANQQAPVLLRVADLSTMTVQTQVSEADIGQLRPHMDAYFTTLGNRGRRWWGTLRKVEPTPTVTNNVVLYNALFDVENDQRNLLPQMTAQVFFVAATAQDVLVVPASAVTVQRPERDRLARRGERSSGGAAASSEASAASAVPPRASAPRAVVPRASRPQAASGGEMPREVSREASREDRRAMFERMDPAEREAMRGRMREARAQREGGGAAPSLVAEVRHVPTPRAAPPKPVVWAGVSAARPRQARDGLVKVLTSTGQIEERKVKLGISNRVQIQVLEGLREGEKVVAGIKPPPSQARADGNRNALQGQAGMPPGAGPGGMGAGGGAGGGRAR